MNCHGDRLRKRGSAQVEVSRHGVEPVSGHAEIVGETAVGVDPENLHLGADRIAALFTATAYAASQKRLYHHGVPRFVAGNAGAQGGYRPRHLVSQRPTGRQEGRI
jgi:hypothetical protein